VERIDDSRITKAERQKDLTYPQILYHP
jgi:hypothetical protein